MIPKSELVSLDDDGGGRSSSGVIAGEEEWTGDRYEGKVSKWARYFRDLKSVSCTLLYHTLKLSNSSGG